MRIRSSVALAAGLAAVIGSAPLAAQEAIEDEQISQLINASFEGEVTVTGSLIPRADLTSLSPVTVLDVQRELPLAGTTRIEDLVVSLPQVFPGQNSTVANGASGTATIDLRFLGAQRTLVLVNGRRMAVGGGFESAADINAIPAPLVERVDILTGGASTVYGSDAMAGVVNFVLDTDFTGIRGGVQYGTYQHDNDNELAQQLNAEAGFDYPSGVTWDGGTLNAYLAIGGKLGDGRGHAAAYIDYRRIDELTKSSRDYLNCAMAAGADGPYCGGSMTTQRGTFIAYNADYSFNGVYTLDLTEEGGDGHSFRPWTGERFNYGPWNHIQRPDEKWNAGAFAHYTANEHLEPYLEVMFMSDFSDAQIAPSGNFGVTETIYCGNPMLSEQQRDILCTQAGYGPEDSALVVSLRRNVEGGPRRSEINNDNLRLVAGLRGDLGDLWSYDLYALHAQTSGQNSLFNDFDVNRIRNALDVIADPVTGEWVCRSGDPGCVPYNIFQEGGVTQEAIDYMSTVATWQDRSRTQVVNLTFIGDLEGYGLRSPAAREGLQVAVGGEYRSEHLEIRPDEVWQEGTAGFEGGVQPFDGGFDVSELFLEVLVPVVQDARGAEDLSVELGYRYSDYSTSGGSNTFKALLNWAITGGWRLRGGYNRAVRSPNAWELFEPETWYTGGTDVCANDPDTGVPQASLEECLRTGMTAAQYGTVPPYGQIRGVWSGNLLLEPEVADTYTAGVVWTPPRVPGLSVTADYYTIDIGGAITGVNAYSTVLLCARTGDPEQCGRIHRDEYGSLFLTEDAYVDSSYQNFQALGAEGVDLIAGYLVALGDAGFLPIELVGTYTLSRYTEDPLIGFDCAGYWGAWCGQANPRWRHRLRATWETAFNLDLSLAWRRVGSSQIDASSPDPDLADPDYMEIARANGIDEIPAYDWFDLAVSYSFNDAVRVTLGINNILDEEPPLLPGWADSTGTWFNLYGNYDPLGRYIFANVQLNF
jgi:outer membrane receptor protein involved in Fe transport